MHLQKNVFSGNHRNILAVTDPGRNGSKVRTEQKSG